MFEWQRIATVLRVALFFNAAILPIAAQSSTEADVDFGTYPGFKVRYGIPDGTNLASLVNKPTLIGMTVKSFRDPASGERRLNGFGEAHAVFDVPLDAVFSVLQDYPGQKSYSKRLLDVRVESQDENRAVVYQDIGIIFLGFKFGSRVRSEIVVDRLGPGELGIRARLVESVDHNLFESFSSWYLKEVEVDGKTMLYLRTFTSPGLRNPFIGVAGVIKNFTPPELRGQLQDTVKEALRRLASKQPGP